MDNRVEKKGLEGSHNWDSSLHMKLITKDLYYGDKRKDLLFLLRWMEGFTNPTIYFIVNTFTSRVTEHVSSTII